MTPPPSLPFTGLTFKGKSHGEADGGPLRSPACAVVGRLSGQVLKMLLEGRIDNMTHDEHVRMVFITRAAVSGRLPYKTGVTIRGGHIVRYPPQCLAHTGT